jgi:Excalibur calcium-binding domain
MTRMSALMGALAAAIVLTACGGGGGDEADKNARCSDFRYQEDAQDALNRGASQLDGDHDGIACESLPHRPASPPAQSNASAAGLWSGTTNTNRSVTGLVLSDGTYYVVYTVAGNPAVLAGVVQGSGAASGNTFSSSNGRDFNLEGQGTLSASVNASVQTRQTLVGSINYASGVVVPFTSSYDARYELTPSFAVVAGTFNGQFASIAGVQTATVTVSPTGQISSTSNGCTMTGSAVPRSDSNVYNVTVTFGPSPCRFANQSLSGIGYFDSATKRLYAAAPNSARSDAAIFLGTKP